MNDSRSIRVPAEDGGSGIDRKALWVVRELGLPAIVTACVSCRSARHHPTGKFRVNANGKLLDVWMLICCQQCGRTSKIPVHERIHVRALEHERLLMFENNDPAMVRHLAMDAALAGKAVYQLDWSGTWELETDMPFHELGRDPAPLEVVIRFELPAPIRIEKLLTAGFGLSRSAVRRMVDAGRIRLPMAIDAKAREDFTLFVITTPPPSREAERIRRSSDPPEVALDVHADRCQRCRFVSTHQVTNNRRSDSVRVRDVPVNRPSRRLRRAATRGRHL